MTTTLLIIGSGAREHALARFSSRILTASEIVVAPGNGLSRQQYRSLPGVHLDDVASIVAAAQACSPTWIWIGPEQPLALGVVDALHAAGFHVLGPTREATKLESSKVYAKRAMQAAGVPTAPFGVVSSVAEAQRYLESNPEACVVKADGLMAGKGVEVCDTPAEALLAVQRLLEAGQTQIVLEKRLRGPELSLIALSDGKNYLLLPTARDYKRLKEGDQGPNTGGMGAYSPVERDSEVLKALGLRFIDPILTYQREQGAPFKGFLYAGLLMHEGEQGPETYALEYNARLGDPEAQAIFAVMPPHWVNLFADAAKGEVPSNLHTQAIIPQNYACCIVVAAEGYPAKPRLGDRITGLSEAQAIADVLGAGVIEDEEDKTQLKSCGGRILSVVGLARNPTKARHRAYEALKSIQIPGQQSRADIAVGSELEEDEL